MTTWLVVFLAIFAWTLAAVLVGVVLGRMFARRDEQIPSSPSTDDEGDES